MKKTILLSSLFAAAAAVAGEVVSSNAVAALNKPIDVKAKQTLLAVPFEGYETSGKVKVADIVKTSDLADGSKLYVPNGGGYDTWTLTGGEWVAGKKVTVGPNGEVGEEVTDSASNVQINRGDAFWLEPKFDTGNTTGTVFLLGQGDGTPGTSTVAAKVWNLVGNASTEEVSLAGLESSDLDQIIVQVDGALRYYTYKKAKGGWRYQIGTDWSKPDEKPLKIAPGQGFWYKSAEAKIINWTNKTQN